MTNYHFTAQLDEDTTAQVHAFGYPGSAVLSIAPAGTDWIGLHFCSLMPVTDQIEVADRLLAAVREWRDTIAAQDAGREVDA